VPTSSLQQNVDNPPIRPLTIRASGSGRQRVIALAGEFDMASADAVQRELIGAERSGARCIALDLRELSFIDCSGLRVILAADRRAGERLVIVKGPTQVRRVFALCGLDARLTFVDEPPPYTRDGPPESVGPCRAGQPAAQRRSLSTRAAAALRWRGRPRPIR
jgi:anti-anti-sigma factor